MDVDNHLIESVEVVKKVPWYMFIGDFFNILKAFIGTNYQGLPFAFKNSGLAIGIGGVAFIACLTDYCCQLLIKCKHIVIDNVIAEEADQLNEEERAELRSNLNKTVGYGDLARRAFGGKWGNFMYHLIQIAVWFTQYLTCVAYFIFIGNTIFEMYPLVPVETPTTNSTPVAFRESHMASGVSILAMVNLDHRPIRSSSQDIYSEVNSYNVYNESTQTFEDLAEMEHFAHLTTTKAPTTTPKVPICYPTTHTNGTVPPAISCVSLAPDLKLLILFPLGFFLLTSLIRKLRKIAPFSVIASVALGIGAISVFAFLCVDYAVADTGFSWVKFSTLPLFIGQLISAYEGIGCIVPIESSMEGNQHLFAKFLHANVFIVFVILTAFGSVGYTRYGENVKQLVVQSIPQHTLLAMMVDVTLIISVLFTYPLQCFPVIEIVENYLFAPGACMGPPHVPPHAGHVQVPQSDVEEADDFRSSLEASVASVAVTVPQKVASWKRNVVRVLLTFSILGFAVLARNEYAYLAAFSGALACSLLAYILPCVIHLQLCSRTCHISYVIGHIIIICLACLASVFTLIVIFYKIASHQVLD